MKKILVISHGFQEHYTVGFANGLAKNGCHVTLVRSSTLDTAHLDPAIRSLELGQNTGAPGSAVLKALRFVRYHVRLTLLAITGRYPNIHIIGLLRHELVSGVIEGLIFRLLSKRFVLTVHNILPHDNHTSWNRTLYALIYRVPHILVVHTAKMRDTLITDFRIHSDRIRVIEHGLNDAVIDHRWTKSTCRAALGFADDVFILLFFGRIAPYKGLETLLDAFEQLDERHFLAIAGAPISKPYGAEISNRIDKHPARSRIVGKLDWIRDDEIATYFRACDCLVMPYRHIDQSGLVFLSLRFGLPVISFNVGSIRDYVSDGIGIVVEQGTRQGLAAAITQLKENQDSYSREWIREQAGKYLWKNVIAPLVEDYAE